MLGSCYYERYELEEAIREIETAIELTPPYLVDQQVELKKLLADIHVTQRRYDEARRLLLEIAGLPLHERDPRLQQSIELARARLALREGDMAEAMEWSRNFEARMVAEQEEGRARPPASSRSLDPIERSTYVRILLAAGDTNKALAIMETMLDEISSSRTPFLRRINMLILYAIALRRADRLEAALDALAEALRMAAPVGAIRPFAYDAGEVGPLLARLFRSRREPLPRAYRESLYRACGLDPEALPVPVKDRATTFDLTSREREILQLISLGYSNRKIAEKLYVSINTVKTHAGNLFDKLGARSRVEALARAREEGILE
jgi:LuxR family maltose regulon positive regulatory protein